jgi:hypothetical protein
MAKLQFSPDKVQSDIEAEANINQIVDSVAADPEGRFLLTKNGDPSVVIVNVNYIQNLLGDQVVNPNQQAFPSESQQTPPQPTAPSPNVSDFMSQTRQPMPPQEVQQKPPLEPPTATDFRPLISPLNAGQPPAPATNQPFPNEPPPTEIPTTQSPPQQGPGTPLIPPSPPPSQSAGPPFLGSQQ